MVIKPTLNFLVLTLDFMKQALYLMMVQFMSDNSGLKTRYLGLNYLGTAFVQPLVSSLSWKIVMGT